MNVATQISGTIRPGLMALRALKSISTFVGIRTVQPVKDQPLFNTTDSKARWEHYDNELAFYGSIAGSPFHIVYSDGAINEKIALQIAYAMLKNRPVIITGTPLFHKELHPFLREVIMNHSYMFYSVDLAKLELTELSLLLAKVTSADYSLSKNEQVLITASLRAYFRKLAA